MKSDRLGAMTTYFPEEPVPVTDRPLTEEPFSNVQSEQKDTPNAALEYLRRYTGTTVTNDMALGKDGSIV